MDKTSVKVCGYWAGLGCGLLVGWGSVWVFRVLCVAWQRLIIYIMYPGLVE